MRLLLMSVLALQERFRSKSKWGTRMPSAAEAYGQGA